MEASIRPLALLFTYVILLTAHIRQVGPLSRAAWDAGGIGSGASRPEKAAQNTAIPDPLIVGGDVVKNDRFPYAAVIFDKDRAYCSGALIHPQVILTAAHCTQTPYVGVKVGARNWLLDDIYGRKYHATKVAKAIVHPDFKKNNNRVFLDMIGDLALMVLASPVPGPNVTVINLPTKTMKLPKDLQSLGYGATSEGSGQMSNELRTVRLNEVQRPTCNKLLNKINSKAYNLTDATVCAGYLKGGKDTCQGDSGGPLFIKGKAPGQDVVVGLTSFGEGCARRNAPAGYTNIRMYSDWIQKELDKLVKANIIKAVVKSA